VRHRADRLQVARRIDSASAHFFFSVPLPGSNAAAVAAFRAVFFARFFVGGVAATSIAVTRGAFVLLAQTNQQVHESVAQGLLRRVLRAHHEKARARRVVLGGGGGGSDPPVWRAGLDLREARARRVGRRRVLLRVRDADGHGDRVRGGPRGRGVVVGAHDFDRAFASAQELTTRRDAPLERARGVVVRAEAFERARRRERVVPAELHVRHALVRDVPHVAHDPERREERLELGGGTSASAHHEKTRGGGAWVGGNGSGGHRACVRTSSGHRESVRISKPGFRYARAAPKAPGLAI
jgi:hypothetical protein